MMRGVYVPHDLKSLQLSQDAERLLTNLVLDGRVSLELISEKDFDGITDDVAGAAPPVETDIGLNKELCA